MKRHIRIAATVFAAVMLLASCGGGDSSSRTKNSALCYIDQAEKDAAVQRAQEAFDASFGGAPTDETPEESPEETPTSVDEETPTSVEEETSTTVEEGAFGGGYRRPAVRAASSGDATVPPAEDGGEVVLTPEQQQAQMDLEAAEAQPLCEAEGVVTTVECTGTITDEPGVEVRVTDDCPDGWLFTSRGNDSDIWILAKDGAAMDDSSAVLAQGVVDFSTLTPEQPILIPISYGLAGSSSESSEEQSKDATCTADVSAASVIFTCSKQIDTVVHVTYADGAGTHTFTGNGNTTYSIPENVQGYQFAACPVGGLDNIYADTCYINNDNFWTSGNDLVREFTVPADVADAVSGELEIDSSDLEYEFSGEFAAGGYYYHQGDSENATFIQITSGGSCEEAPFTLYWYIFNGSSWDGSSSDTAWDVDGTCTYTYGDSYTDEYIVEVDSASTINWQATVDFRGSSAEEIDGEGEEIDTPFEYTFESASVRYSFELTEVTEVRITGNTFMSCEGRNQIVPDPEMTLSEGFGSNLDETAYADNNYSDSDVNCSAAEIYEELESGQYVLDVINEDYDNPTERGTITIRSSIELVEVVRDWSQINLRNESVNPPKVFDVTIPEGGALFVATADSLNSDEQCETAGDDDNPLTYVDPYIILINKLTGAVIYSDDSGENIGLPCYSSYLELEVDGGEYLFIATTYALAEDDGDYTDGEIAGTYALEFGVSGSEVPEDVVIEESTEPAPPVEIPAPPALPVGQLVEPGSKGTVQIADGVTSMVCTSTCIDELFAAVDPSVGSLQVAIGKNTVELKRNSKKAVVAVEAGSRSVNVVAVSDTGVETKVLTGQVQIGAPEVLVSEDSSSEGSSMNLILMILLALIVVGGVGTVAIRKRSATN